MLTNTKLDNMTNLLSERGRALNTGGGSRVRHLDNHDTTKWTIGIIVGHLDKAEARHAVDGTSASGTSRDLNGVGLCQSC